MSSDRWIPSPFPATAIAFSIAGPMPRRSMSAIVSAVTPAFLMLSRSPGSTSRSPSNTPRSPPVVPRRSGERAHRHRMVAAEDERDVAGAHDVRDRARKLLAGSHDLGDVVRARTLEHALRIDLLVRVCRETLIGIGHADVAPVAHPKADLGELGDESAVADARRAHVDPAPVAAEIHRHPDDLDDRATLHTAHLLGIHLAQETFSAHRAVCFAAVAARGWKIAWITPSAASSSPTNARTFTRAKPRRIFSMTASNRAVSPDRTMRLKRISSMPAKSPRPSRYSGSAMAITVA